MDQNTKTKTKNIANYSSGYRKITAEMLIIRDNADRFKGLPEGSAKPFKYLAAFQEAEPYLGLPKDSCKLITWLVKQTRAQDWEEGSRPICWPSATSQAEHLCISIRTVRRLNRTL